MYSTVIDAIMIFAVATLLHQGAVNVKVGIGINHENIKSGAHNN
jgi:hypothetical protein